MKLLGVLLILLGALGIGRQNNVSIRAHYRQLVQWKECLLRLEQGIQLKHPLLEVLYQMKQEEEPFGSFFAALLAKLNTYEQSSPMDVWKQVVKERAESFPWTTEEMQLLYDCGRVIETGSRDMAAKEVTLIVGQIEYHIRKEQEELANRLKVNMYLCTTAGIFLILLLI